jgi:hypothetical protein
MSSVTGYDLLMVAREIKDGMNAIGSGLQAIAVAISNANAQKK